MITNAKRESPVRQPITLTYKAAPVVKQLNERRESLTVANRFATLNSRYLSIPRESRSPPVGQMRARNRSMSVPAIDHSSLVDFEAIQAQIKLQRDDLRIRSLIGVDKPIFNAESPRPPTPYETKGVRRASIASHPIEVRVPIECSNDENVLFQRRYENPSRAASVDRRVSSPYIKINLFKEEQSRDKPRVSSESVESLLEAVNGSSRINSV